METGLGPGTEDDFAELGDYVTLTQPQMLIGPSRRKGALFAEWGRQKRKIALQQRYGEDVGLGSGYDDQLDASWWTDRP